MAVSLPIGKLNGFFLTQFLL